MQRADMLWRILLASLLVGCTVQQSKSDKIVLPKNTVLPLGNLNFEAGDSHYHHVTVDLYIGADNKDVGSPNKVKFIVDFVGNATIVQGYDAQSCPSAFNFTPAAGFEAVGTKWRDYQYRKQLSFTLSDHHGWLRLDPQLKIRPETPKTALKLSRNCESWVERSPDLENVGMISLGPRSDFFEMLVQTYQPEQADQDRIPVSWSLKPLNKDHMFDSRVRMDPNTFILNGHRSENKQFGMKAPIRSGSVWYYEGMNFKMGSIWLATNQRVCIDPHFPAFVGLPIAKFEEYANFFSSLVCESPFGSCPNLQQNLRRVPTLYVEILDATKTPRPLFSIKQASIYPKSTEFAEQMVGVEVFSSTVADSECRGSDIIIGKYFFTRVEMTFWLHKNYSASNPRPDDVLVSFSPIEIEADPSSQSQSLHWLADFALFGGFALWVVLTARWLRSNGKSNNDDYQAGISEAHD